MKKQNCSGVMSGKFAKASACQSERKTLRYVVGKAWGSRHIGQQLLIVF